jgi:hypothetical protein
MIQADFGALAVFLGLLLLFLGALVWWGLVPVGAALVLGGGLYVQKTQAPSDLVRARWRGP